MALCINSYRGQQCCFGTYIQGKSALVYVFNPESVIHIKALHKASIFMFRTLIYNCTQAVVTRMLLSFADRSSWT